MNMGEKENVSKSEKIDWDLVNQIKRSLEDIKHGRITEWEK